jgi:hypothetical protein
MSSYQNTRSNGFEVVPNMEVRGRGSKSSKFMASSYTQITEVSSTGATGSQNTKLNSSSMQLISKK